MLCPVCGCQLAATAQSCEKCGSRVESEVPTHIPQEIAPPPQMFCASCGHPYEPSHRFCYSCGRAIPPQPGSTIEAIAPGIGGPAAAAAQLQPESPSLPLTPAMQVEAP